MMKEKAKESVYLKRTNEDGEWEREKMRMSCGNEKKKGDGKVAEERR